MWRNQNARMRGRYIGKGPLRGIAADSRWIFHRLVGGIRGTRVGRGCGEEARAGGRAVPYRSVTTGPMKAIATHGTPMSFSLIRADVQGRGPVGEYSTYVLPGSRGSRHIVMWARLTTKRGVVTYVADAEVAQLVEQRTENPCVASSILALGTTTHPRRAIQGRSGGIGRRGGLKNHWGKPCPGSSPGFGTKHRLYTVIYTDLGDAKRIISAYSGPNSERGRGMNDHDETDIDNLPFEEYAQVMSERGRAAIGNPDRQ